MKKCRKKDQIILLPNQEVQLISQNFFSGVKGIPSYSSGSEAVLIEDIDDILASLKTSLAAKNKVAKLTAEISELLVERKHLEEWHKENVNVKLIDVNKYKLSSEKCSDLLAYINYLSQKKSYVQRKISLIVRVQNI